MTRQNRIHKRLVRLECAEKKHLRKKQTICYPDSVYPFHKRYVRRRSRTIVGESVRRELRRWMRND